MGNKGINTLPTAPKGISSKVNVIAWRGRKLANYVIAVQHFSHYATDDMKKKMPSVSHYQFW